MLRRFRACLRKLDRGEILYLKREQRFLALRAKIATTLERMNADEMARRRRKSPRRAGRAKENTGRAPLSRRR